MKNPLVVLLLLVLQGIALAAPASDQPHLVKDGAPKSEIIIAETPTRSARLAAEDLRTYIRKISGATLPIATQPSSEGRLQIYVGESEHTQKLGIDPSDLKYGAYRMVSGDNWLALIGGDKDFEPIEPWAKNNGGIRSGWLQEEWEKRIGEPFGAPNGGMYKNRERLPGTIGKPDGVETPKDEVMEVWGFDERGSFNAVCGYLRSLGVRWYMPGEIGEVLPEMASIPLPEIDETVHPDFEVRRFNDRFSTSTDPTMYWMMRLGTRDPYGLMVAHGMDGMTRPDILKELHPDWFALYGGKRDLDTTERLNHLCYSNPELFEATVRYARAQFDVYDYATVSIMPPDAYIAICQCELCEGKDVPEMGARGKLSNHVWDFVNRVAKEVGKTHPDKKIVCCAYGANTDPPTNIDQLEPNVQVIIVGGRRPRSTDEEQRQAIRQLRAGWKEKTQNPYMIFENYPFTARGTYLPAFVAGTIGESINATKGESSGEDIWLSFSQDFDTNDIAFNHFQVYFTARMYWGGKEQDVMEMLDEYCRLFYGPAGTQMKEFFNFCEANYQSMDKEKEPVDQALAMFAAAQGQVEPGSIYAQRLDLLDEFLERLRAKAAVLGQKRGPVSKLRTVWDPKEPIVIDGKLDDQYWRDCPTSSIGSLRELQTGRLPIYGTKIMTGWDRGDLCFAIICEEKPGEPLNIATTENEDQSIWYGDVVEILLETDSHSYYQIAVNPAGALADLDRGADKSARFRWESQAEVATQIEEGRWTIEIRIPVTDDQNDPLNQVVGTQPSSSLPWFFNICRQRIRDNGKEFSAFSPTGTTGFHEPMKFAHFHDGGSHTFEVNETVTDFLIGSSAANELQRAKKYEEALSAYVALSEHEKVSDFQKADVLAKAAECARRMEDMSKAAELADRIPLESVAKTVRMENLVAQREWEALIEQYGGEPISEWPYWQIGAGAYARAKAYYSSKEGEKADADLTLALAYTPDARTRTSMLRMMGHNRETILENDETALEAYRQVTDHGSGGSDYYYSIQGVARILTRKGDFDGAIKVLDQADVDKIGGSWKGSILLSRGETLEAAGRKAEAIETYQQVVAHEGSHAGHKTSAQEAIARLQGQ